MADFDKIRGPMQYESTGYNVYNIKHYKHTCIYLDVLTEQNMQYITVCIYT